MTFEHRLSDPLKAKLKKICKKNKKRYEIIKKKITEICNSDKTTIQHYKNLKHDQKDRKRVHIDKSFVLTFKYNKSRNFILFEC